MGQGRGWIRLSEPRDRGQDCQQTKSLRFEAIIGPAMHWWLALGKPECYSPNRPPMSGIGIGDVSEERWYQI